MFSSITILSACTVCSWQLLPMLLGAWILGWIFWQLFRGATLKNNIIDLKANVSKLKTSEAGLKEEISNVNYDKEKIYADMLSSRSQFDDLELKYNALYERNIDVENNLRSFQNNAVQDGVPQAEYDKLKHNYALLKEQMETQKTVKVGVAQASYDALKADLDLAKSRVKELENKPPQVIEKIVEVEKIVEKVIYKEKPSLSNDLSSTSISPLVSGAFPPSPTEDEVEVPKTTIEEVIPTEDTVIENAIPVDIIGEDNPKDGHQYDRLFKNNDLKIIEGVGPKIEGLLKAAGFVDWNSLANAKQSELQKVLDDAGPRYRVHDPTSWIEQASFAAKGDWSGLIKFQKFLGNTEKTEGQAKVEKLADKAVGLKATKLNDLKVIEGIGPKIEEHLKNGGIKTWEDLANAQQSRLQQILTDAGPRYRLAVPDTWPEQAALAAKGKWDELKKLQDVLNGGRKV